jgi:hypothetical protein
MTMTTTTTAHRPSGSPASTGGQFAEGRHDEADVSLAADTLAAGESACATCGKGTKRSSGLCRRCDPKAKTNRDAKPGRSASPVKGVEADKPSGPILDRTGDPLTAEEIFQCTYGFVPVYRSGARVESAVRECRNAVTEEGAACHQHGGACGTSLGRTVTKARAEAERGECFPLAAEHWEAADQRLAAAQGQLLGILGTDTSKLAAAFVAWRRQQGDTPSRFSVNNQFLVLVQHLVNEREGDEVADWEAAWAAAAERSAEPHMTKAAWAKLGREPLPDADGVAVVWWQPGGGPAAKRDDESQEDYDKRLESESPGWRGRHGAYVQFPLSATAGDHYEVVEEPLAVARPTGFGDPAKAMDAMTGLATDMGIKVELVGRRPANGALAYWNALDSKIVVWSGIGGGDQRAVAHATAHELGHARLGHSTDAGKETRSAEKEMAAESFAALVCAHHGIDASEISADYIEGWRTGSGINMEAAGLGPLRSAVEAFDEYVTATAPAA